MKFIHQINGTITSNEKCTARRLHVQCVNTSRCRCLLRCFDDIFVLVVSEGGQVSDQLRVAFEEEALERVAGLAHRRVVLVEDLAVLEHLQRVDDELRAPSVSETTSA